MGHFSLWDLKVLNAFFVSLCEHSFIYQLDISYLNSSVLCYASWRHCQISVAGIPTNLHIVWVTSSEAKQQYLSTALFCIPLQFLYYWFGFNLSFSNAITNGWTKRLECGYYTVHRLEDWRWNGRQENLLNITSIFLNFNPYPTAFPYGSGMVLHFYQQQESSTTKTVHKVINKGLKAYV